MAKPLRALKFLQSQGFGSRKDCSKIIKLGKLSINGSIVIDSKYLIEPSTKEFIVDDEEYIYREHLYIALNKPAGYECSTNSTHHTPILSLLNKNAIVRGVQPIGRLDVDTTGLILFTDDGKFNHKISSPKGKIGKQYLVTCKHPFSLKNRDELLDGIVLNDSLDSIKASDVEIISENEILLTISEGKYHQVKRMIAAVSNRVEMLKRVSIGSLKLADMNINEGEYIYLDKNIIEDKD